MRQRVPAVRAALAILAIMVSFTLVCCTTTSLSFTDDEVAFTMDYVIHRIEERTVSELFMRLNEFREPMVPTEYIVMNQLRHDIPGMDRILTDWAHQTTTYILGFYESFRQYSADIAANQVFADPGALLSSGSSSISLYMRRLHFDAMKQVIKQSITEIDPTYWQQAVIQYNAWVNTTNLLTGQNLKTFSTDFDAETVMDMVAAHLADLYFKVFSTEEVLIRTTPDPDLDSTAARVLGLI